MEQKSKPVPIKIPLSGRKQSQNQTKLSIKLADFVTECEQLYEIKIVHGDTIKMKHVKKLRKKLYAFKQSWYWETKNSTSKEYFHCMSGEISGINAVLNS